MSLYESIQVGRNRIEFIQKGIGEDLLFLHGFGVPPHKDLETINLLATKFHVVAPKLAAMNYLEEQPKTLLECVELAKDFRTKVGINSGYIIGHSYGARMVVDILKDPQIDIKAGIALNPVIPSNYSYPQTKLSLTALYLVLKHDLGLRDYIFNSLKKYPTTRGLANDVANCTWEDFDNVVIPALIIHSDKDEFFQGVIRDIEPIIQEKKNLEIKLMKGHSHFFHKENPSHAFYLISNYLSQFESK